jgi:hypothetical protein
LPVIVPILPGPTFAGGHVMIDVTGFLAGMTVGMGHFEGDVAPGQHLQIGAKNGSGDCLMGGQSGNCGQNQFFCAGQQPGQNGMCCNTGQSCCNGQCSPPGGCCPVQCGGVCCPNAQYTCMSNACVPTCGGAGQPCCNGTMCNGSLSCSLGMCCLNGQCGGFDLGGSSDLDMATLPPPWSVRHSFAGGSFLSVSGDNQGHVWAAGSGGVFKSSGGGAFNQVLIQACNAVAGLNGTAWAVGPAGTIWYDNGTTWNQTGALDAGVAGDLHGVYAASASQAWAVGGGILAYDGLTWAPQSDPVVGALQWVGTNYPNSFYAVGSGGAVAYWGGSSWSLKPTGVGTSLTGAWGDNFYQLLVVGYNGTLLSMDMGGTFTPITVPTKSNLRAIWGWSTKLVYIVGDSSTALISNDGGLTFSPESLPVAADLYSVWGTGPSDLWAAGIEQPSGQGVILHRP